MDKMTSRERMLAVLQGRKPDRVPFVTYDNVAAPNNEVWSHIGHENMGLIRWSRVHQYITPNCRFYSRPVTKEGLKGIQTVMHTSSGQLMQEKYFDPTYGSPSISKHYVESEEDYLVFREYLKDIIVVPDDDTFIKDMYDLGDDGLPMIEVGRTAYQQLWVLWVSLLDLSIHFADIPEKMGEVTELLNNIQRRVFNTVYSALERLPIPYVCIPDNLTAPTIGPDNFRKYCLPMYKELVGMLKDKGVPVVVHMDGDLMPLWSLIGESGVNGIDSFSSPPDNDTSVSKALSMWPNIRLLLNFPSSIHLTPAEKVYETAMQILEEGGHTGQIWIQISESVPPYRWKTSYSAIVKAIQDFGTP